MKKGKVKHTKNIPSTEELSEEFEDRLEAPQLRGNTYWWVTTIHGGRTIVLGPFSSEEEANEVGYQRLDGNYNVHSLPTRDESTATRMLKGKKLKEDSTLGESLKRFRHKTKGGIR
ncbi:hypothetical protein ES704_01418 [subsurface metagenome]|jgi:hypothetical protein